MFYLKIENEKIIQAPKNCVRKGFQVFGYNSPANIKMLKEDGYSAYDFPASQAEIVEGKIVKMGVPAPAPRTTFTKLEIRRACRTLELEDKLNGLLKSNEIFASDWADAQEIDLNDIMFMEAVEAGVFTDAEINQVKEYLQ